MMFKLETAKPSKPPTTKVHHNGRFLQGYIGIPMLTEGLGSSALVGGFGILEPRLSVSRVQQIFAHANGSLPGFCFRDVLQLLSSTPAADVLELWQLELCGKYLKLHADNL